jgi:secreted trypsin-like serine protease
MSILAAVTLAAAATLVTPYAAAQADEIRPNVVGGGPVASAPWAAGLYTDGSFGCSGAIIASRWVLTARHCVGGGSPTHVRIGDVRLNQGTNVRVTRVVEAPNADMALLRLSRAVNTTYAPVASADPPVGASTEIYGWGTTLVGEPSPENPVSPVLKIGIMRVLSIGEDVFGGPSIHAQKIDAVAGYGDSGGPMWHDGQVVGVCSHGDLEYVHSDYGSVTANRDWIRETAGV